MKRAIPTLAAAACAVIAAGCITYEGTTVRDVERVRVEFENEAAARIFYDALSRAPEHERRSESKTEVELPILFKHTERVVSGSNAAFNRAVELCDSNKDGKITEQEARIYAEHVAK